MWSFTIQCGSIPPCEPRVKIRARVKRGKLLEYRSFVQLNKNIIIARKALNIRQPAGVSIDVTSIELLQRSQPTTLFIAMYDMIY